MGLASDPRDKVVSRSFLQDSILVGMLEERSVEFVLLGRVQSKAIMPW